MSEDRIETLEEKAEDLQRQLREVKHDQHQLEENLRSGLGHAEAHAIEQAKQEIVKEYSRDEAHGKVSETSDSLEPVAYILRHECDRQGVHNQTLVWASSPFPHRCNVCRDVLDETHVHKTLVERSEKGESSE